jgi:hypothetical protein
MLENKCETLNLNPKTKKYLHQTQENKPSLNDINETATESRTSTVALRQSEDEACPKSSKSSSNGYFIRFKYHVKPDAGVYCICTSEVLIDRIKDLDQKSGIYWINAIAPEYVLGLSYKTV